ncbi:MAG TPA: thioredoxin family protein [Vicingaceae bacterium]|nr:thioredoxin family protein [Vicingaceae bacterium]
MITQQHIDKGISFEAYHQLYQEQVANGQTSGLDQSEGLIAYTKLNFSRLKRSYKTTEIANETKAMLEKISTPLTWLVLTETWCGDAAQNIPVLAKMAELNPAISLKLIFRDENPEVMDNFLTNGSKSIPKLICVNENLEVLGTWGPRPAAIQSWFVEEKNKPTTDMDQLKIDLQQKYNADKGLSLQSELMELLQQWQSKKMTTAV